MRPTLFTVRLGGGQLAFPSYGILVALGITVGIVWFVRAGKRAGLDGGRLQDLAFASIVLGFVGARVAFVLLNGRAFLAACVGATVGLSGRLAGCSAALRFWEGGFVFYGGAVTVAMGVLAFCRRERWSFLELGDLAAPAVALGHAIGRLGCLMAGCCYGKSCAPSGMVFWAVSFPPGSIAFDDEVAAGAISPASLRTLPLHPTQVYEAVGELIIVAVLWHLRRRNDRRQGQSTSVATPGSPPGHAPGKVLTVYLILYAGLRSVVELFRGDAARGFLVRWSNPGLSAALGLPRGEPVVLSTSQFASLLVVAAAIGVELFRRHADRTPADAARSPKRAREKGPSPAPGSLR
jgi:phosphatidylglycerol:prolipoprotein diacylglycerol transferase